MLEIIPSILTNDPKELENLLGMCEGVVERVHIDIIDGKFANNRTIDPSVLDDTDTSLLLDYHLMVQEPVNWVEKCVRAMADRVIAQIEKMSDQVEFVGKVQEVGAKVGLGIDLDTAVSKLDSVILNNLDVVLVMSVKAGFGGQPFDKKAIDKIRKLDEIRVRDDTPFRICDDGGITLESIDDAHYTGADEVAIGRGLFKGSLSENLKKYQRAAHGIK